LKLRLSPFSGFVFEAIAEAAYRREIARFIRLLFNLFALTNLGSVLEGALGTARFTVIYLGSVVFGFGCWWLWGTQFAIGPTAGASGGIFGLLGALIGYLYARRDPAWKDLLMRNLQVNEH